MVSIKNLIFIITAVSALPVSKRDAAAILTDITTIGTNVKALTGAFNGYTGGLISAVPILGVEGKLEESIKKATTDAKALPQQNSADSQSVLAAIDGLTPTIEDALGAVQKKKQQFATDGLTPTVQKDIANLKGETDALADALIAIASDDTKEQGTAQKTKLAAQFDAAVATFA